MSHLFAQGLISGRAFVGDLRFREKINKKIPEVFKLEQWEKRPDASKYKIIFAIIMKPNKDLYIPFFSKIVLKTVVDELKLLGFKISLTKISTKATLND